MAIAAAAADGRLPRGHPHHARGSEAADGDGGPAQAGHRDRAHGGGGMKRLMIVADHSFVVQAIRLALRQTAGFQVVGFFDGRGSVRNALDRAAARRRPRGRHAGDRERAGPPARDRRGRPAGEGAAADAADGVRRGSRRRSRPAPRPSSPRPCTRCRSARCCARSRTATSSTASRSRPVAVDRGGLPADRPRARDPASSSPRATPTAASPASCG